MRKLPVARVQGALARLARQLDGIATVLDGLPSRIQDSRQRDAMEEGEIPSDLATFLVGAIENVREGYVRFAQRALEQAAAATEEELERHWREQNVPRSGRRRGPAPVSAG